MQSIASYFSDMPTIHRALVLVGGLSLFFFIEQFIPLFEFKHNKKKHSLLNIFFTLTTVLVNFLMAFILVFSSSWVSEHKFGIIYWTGINTSYWLVGIFGLMLMDFIAAWLVHFIEHKVVFLWQLHLIHHTDQHVNTTTANRHHPGESVIRFLFTTLAIIFIGAPIWLIFMYQTFSVILTQFNHANIKIPSWLDRILSLVICTPDMHRVHHHYRQPYSDTNYGNIFSFWDRIFGTYIKVDNRKLKYGVDTCMDIQKVNSIPSLLKIPFSKYKGHITYDKEEKL